VHGYHEELVTRLRRRLGDQLLGVYAGGSVALGGFDPYLSDLDVAAVSATEVDPSTKREVVEALRHESLSCPARGLEFVLYADSAARSATIDPGFELNLNSGARMSFRVEYEPNAERHWFAIDRAILARHGKALFGPPAHELFAQIPRETLLEVVVEAVEWHRTNEAASGDAVLNACRALRYAEDGVWSSKLSAGTWAAERQHEPRLVARALAARQSQEPLSTVEVDQFLQRVAERVKQVASRRVDEQCPGPSLRSDPFRWTEPVSSRWDRR
jgi:hypothetical protein